MITIEFCCGLHFLRDCCLDENYNSDFASSTSESRPEKISYFSPTILVVFLMKGEALKSATSSLILSSMLY
jgi:hypothetical protein